MSDDNVCVLVSGGVDSAVLAWHLAENGVEVHPVYVRAGMVWEEVEGRWLGRYLERIASPRVRPLHTLAFPLEDVYRGHWSVAGAAPGYDAPDEAVYLPGRNVILLTKTAVYCALNSIGRVAIGTLAANPFPDATPEFFDSLAQVLSKALSWSIQIDRPFSAMHKADVVRLGAGLPLELTFSCVHPVGDLHCGDCNKCAERQRGFADAGMVDRTTYALPPPQGRP